MSWTLFTLLLVSTTLIDGKTSHATFFTAVDDRTTGTSSDADVTTTKPSTPPPPPPPPPPTRDVTSHHATTICPRGCSCSASHYEAVKATCSYLNPNKQKFPSTIIHLDVTGDDSLFYMGPEFFSKLGLEKLNTLRLSNSSLKEIHPDAFSGMKFLEDLDLSYNEELTTIPLDSFTKLTFLKRVVLRGNPKLRLQASQNRFLASDSITELILSDCGLGIRDLPPRVFSELRSLEYLDLSKNRLTEINDNLLSSLVNLEELNFADNQISSIDRNAFLDIEDLTTLVLRNNQPLKTLESIELSGLKELDASGCSIEILSSATLEGFPGLSTLNLSRNLIKDVDVETFTELPTLRYLDLSYNNIRSPLDRFLFQSNSQLETLSLAGNRDFRVHYGFEGRFSHLYHVDLSGCSLQFITSSAFANMHYVATLNLSNNAINHLEATSFSQMGHLMSLDLSRNRLHNLDSKIFSGNRKLAKLNLSGNYFRHVPAILFQPTPELFDLDLSNNRIAALWNISESFVMKNKNILGRLSYLNVSGNKLRKLHMHSFISTGALEKLDISDNPIECTPDFSHVMQWLMVNRVMPNKGSRPRPVSLNLIDSNIQWDDVLKSVCNPSTVAPISDVNNIDNNLETDDLMKTYPELTPMVPRHKIIIPDLPLENRVPDDEVVSIHLRDGRRPIDVDDDSSRNAYLVQPLEEASFVWPLVLLWVAALFIVVAVGNLVVLMIYRSRRQYRALNVDLGGGFPTGGGGGHASQQRRSGRSVYQKLYEECSVPTPVHNPKSPNIVTIFGLPNFNKNSSSV